LSRRERGNSYPKGKEGGGHHKKEGERGGATKKGTIQIALGPGGRGPLAWGLFYTPLRKRKKKRRRISLPMREGLRCGLGGKGNAAWQFVPGGERGEGLILPAKKRGKSAQ